LCFIDFLYSYMDFNF